MEIIISVFNTFLYRPLFNALILLYQYLPGRDFGIAVIALTLLIRFLLYPLMAKSIKSQKVLSELQPKIQELQQKYKNDKEKQAKEMMEFYKKEKINPMGGCLPLLIQLPILIALYRVFWGGLQPGSVNSLYGFIADPGVINPFFLGLVDLSQASLILAILAGISQFFQSKMMTPKTKKSLSGDKASQFSEMMQKQMLYFFPFFTVFILWKMPSAVALYWLVTALFSIVQQKLIYKKSYDQPRHS